MNRKPMALLNKGILRDIAVHSDPHTLERPQKKDRLPPRPAPVAKARNDEVSASSGHERIQPDLGHAQGYERGYQEGLAEGRKKGYQSAYEEGRKEGLASAAESIREATETASDRARAEQKNALERIEGLRQKLASQIDASFDALEEDAVAMVFEAICMILGERAVTLDGVRSIVERALTNTRLGRNTTIHLHPDDAQMLINCADEYEAQLEGRYGTVINWVADSSIALGGCLIRTEFGGLDARMDTQLENLRKSITETRASRCAEAL